MGASESIQISFRKNRLNIRRRFNSLENKAAGIKGDEGSRNKRSSSLDNVEEIKLDDKPVLTKKRNEKKIKKRRAKRREAYLAKMNAMDRYVQSAERLLFMLTRQQLCSIFY